MELNVQQFSIVSNMFSFTIAAMGAAALFFFLSRSQVGARYRGALLVSGLVVAIAGYHYVRIYESWHAAYRLNEQGLAYLPTGASFNDAYRYADWILTVPLLMVELVAVLALAKSESNSLLAKLVIAAILMIALGYPGEISSDTTTRWIFWAASMIPFLYLLFVMFTQLTASLARQPESVRGLVRLARATVLITWAFYPIAYAIITITGTKSPFGQVALQVGYTIADITAKVGFGLLIYFIARAKTAADSPAEFQESTDPRGVLATA